MLLINLKLYVSHFEVKYLRNCMKTLHCFTLSLPDYKNFGRNENRWDFPLINRIIFHWNNIKKNVSDNGNSGCTPFCVLYFKSHKKEKKILIESPMQLRKSGCIGQVLLSAFKKKNT